MTIYTISKFPNYKILEFPSKIPVKNVRSIDSKNLFAEIVNPDTDELTIKSLNMFGVDHIEKILYLSFIKQPSLEEIPELDLYEGEYYD